MELLKERIRKDGKMKEGSILKVDSFLNHQLDVEMLREIGVEFTRRFADKKISRILTIESSGISIALMAAQAFGNIPVVIAKKSASKNLDGELYLSKVKSYTRGMEYDIQVAKQYLHEDDCVLIVDDFLAKGSALRGLIDIVQRSGAELAGCGIVIEKGFQEGGRNLREQGIRVESLAIVDGIEDGEIRFR